MRSLGGPLLALGYRHDLRGGHHLPARGPAVVVAGGEQGPLVPLALAAWLPRPVRTVGGPPSLGGIDGGPIDRDRGARAALAAGEAVAFPGGPEAAAAAAAAALSSGAVVVPAVLLGTRGRHEADPPRLRSTVTVVVLPPVTVGPEPQDPLAWPAVREAAERIRQALVDAERTVRRRLGGQQR